MSMTGWNQHASERHHQHWRINRPAGSNPPRPQQSSGEPRLSSEQTPVMVRATTSSGGCRIAPNARSHSRRSVPRGSSPPSPSPAVPPEKWWTRAGQNRTSRYLSLLACFPTRSQPPNGSLDTFGPQDDAGPRGRQGPSAGEESRRTYKVSADARDHPHLPDGCESRPWPTGDHCTALDSLDDFHEDR
jgi:hypothetical protein